jgi:hypothetical protein
LHINEYIKENMDLNIYNLSLKQFPIWGMVKEFSGMCVLFINYTKMDLHGNNGRRGYRYAK